VTWHHELDALVRRGRDSLGDAAVADALAAAVESLAPVEVPTFKPPVPVLGTAPCASGVIGVLVRPGGQVTVHVARAADALLDHVADQLDEPGLVVLAAGHVPGDAEERVAGAGLRLPPWYSGSGFERADLVAASYAVVADQPRDGGGEASASRR
jgi:hypothetical protein